MATRRKAKGKARGKRKKASVTKAATRKGDHKSQDNQQKDSEKGVAPVGITQESRADRQDRCQASASQRAGTTRGSEADAGPARSTCFAGAAYRCRDSLLQPPVGRDHTTRARRYAARRRRNPQVRTHHRFHSEGRIARC